MGRWEWKGLVTREDTWAQSDQAQGERGLRELPFPRVRQGLHRCIHCVVSLLFLLFYVRKRQKAKTSPYLGS